MATGPALLDGQGRVNSFAITAAHRAVATAPRRITGQDPPRHQFAGLKASWKRKRHGEETSHGSQTTLSEAHGVCPAGSAKAQGGRGRHRCAPCSGHEIPSGGGDLPRHRGEADGRAGAGVRGRAGSPIARSRLKRPLRLAWRQMCRQFGVDPAKAGEATTVQNFRKDCLRFGGS